MRAEFTDIQSLMAEMTLDEKIAQLGSFWMWDLQTKGLFDSAKMAEKLYHGIGQITRVGGASTMNPLDVARTGNKIQKYLVEETRLGIPAILHEETCTGTMILGGSMYPQVIGLAATFQPELAEEMTRAIRKQMLAIGARQGLAPVLDLGRDPRWGRLEETFGEDPILASQFGVAYVRGLQGNDLRQGVAATGKHFIGHSLSAGGLNCGPVQIGWNHVFELFLAPFQAAIRDAGLATIMNAYPELDGEVVAASRRILTDLLRDTLGFEGLVVSDYEAILMLNNYHHVAEDLATAAKQALNAGIDVELPTVVCYGDPLIAAMKAGNVSLEMIDLAVERHLLLKFDLGLFENPFVDEGKVVEVFETSENRALARKIAGQSMVLLKNDGILPLENLPARVAVIGPSADDRAMLLGDYSYKATRDLVIAQSNEDSMFRGLDPASLMDEDINLVTPFKGLKSRLNGRSEVVTVQGCDALSTDRNGFPEAVSAARNAGLVILTLGDKSGLTPACTSGETRDVSDLRLPGLQEDLAQEILGLGKPVIIVLTIGRPYYVEHLVERANATLIVWLSGEEGGTALADVLFGDVNPGGRLPITFPRSAGQIPINYNHKPSGMRSNWWVDYVNEPVTPQYPFGHGLSYTTFEYGELSLSQTEVLRGDVIDVSIEVQNTGDQAGDEVVQLYIRDEVGRVPRPVKELKGFKRVNLEPGEKKQIIFHFPVDMLAYIDSDLALFLESGTVWLMIGSSSENICTSKKITVLEDATINLSNRVFECPVTVNQA